MHDAFEYDTFISYNQLDKEWVRGTLLPRLESAGLRVCIDFRDFELGAAAVKEMERAVVSSRKTLLVLTPHYLKSEWTEFEYVMLRTLDPANRQRRMISILRSPCSPPLSITAFIYVDLTNDRDSFSWSRLLTSLGTIQSLNAPGAATRADWRIVHPYGMPPNFTGRLAERHALSGWLEKKEGSPLLMIRALGGFGKTSLVWHWLGKDVDPIQWARVVWWSFYDDSSFDEFLRETMDYMGLDAKRAGREAVRLVIEAVRRSNVLLVLDGFERALRAFGGMEAEYQGDVERKDLDGRGADCVSPAAEAFLLSVSSLQDVSCRVLLTTRLRPRVVETRVGELLVGCQEVNLKELDRAEAVDFFYAEGIRGTRAEIEAVCVQYGFHPLSLRLLAGLIMKDLRQPGDIMIAEQLDVSGDLIQRQHHVLEQSYTSLPVEERQLLSRIACFRRAVRYDTLINCLQNMRQPQRPWFLRLFAGDEEKGALDLAVALQDLTTRGLLHRDDRDDRFHLHPIVRRYAYDFLGAEERKATHRGLRDYFAAVPALEDVKALLDLEPVIELYHHTVQAVEYDAAFELYVARLHEPILHQFGAYEQGIELMHVHFPDGADGPPRLRKVRFQSWALGYLALYYSFTGQPQRGMQLFERAAEAAERIGDKETFSIEQVNLATIVLVPVGGLRRAETIFNYNIEYARRESNGLKEAIYHRELGYMLAFLGRWTEAERELEAGRLTFEKEAYARHLGVLSAFYAHLNLLRHRSRRTTDLPEFQAQALAAAHRALELADINTSMNYPLVREYARAHWLVGAALRESRILDGAERHLNEALERCRQINLVEFESDVLIDLGRMRQMQGDAVEARRLADEAAAITERCGYSIQGADAHLLLAHLDMDAADRAGARKHAARARELATCDGPPDYTYRVAYDEAGSLLEHLG